MQCKIIKESLVNSSIMDPKSAASLDPKLKEVYDRVMGTANPQSPPPPQTTPHGTVPVSQPDTSHPPVSTLPKAPDHTSPPASPLSTPPSIPAADKPLGTAKPTPEPALSPLGKPTVDYAALAAKYATPTPNISNISSNAHQAPVTPSSTIYGVVDNKAAKSEKEKKTETKGSSSKKILLLAGIPLLLIGYTAVWVFVFHVDILGFLPLPK